MTENDSGRQYHSADYWEDQYKSQESLGDWYGNYASFRQLLLGCLKEFGGFNQNILITGCGDAGTVS